MPWRNVVFRFNREEKRKGYFMRYINMMDIVKSAKQKTSKSFFTPFGVFVVILFILIFAGAGIFLLFKKENIETLFKPSVESVPKIEINVNAESALIISAKTGTTFFEKEPDKKLYPASTVKLMTAVLALEKKGMDSYITTTSTVTRVEPTIIKLKPSVKYKTSDLICAILINSANDAAVAIAEGVAGSEKEFVKLMNKKALELGMNDTNFTTASGLPLKKKDAQFTTCRDLVKLMKYAAQYEFLLGALSKDEMEIAGSDGVKIKLTTHNKSLFSENSKAWGKTGYTMKARRTFVGVDPSFSPSIIFALMKSDDLWQDISKLKNGGMECYMAKPKSFIEKVREWLSEYKK
ncbi:D-alanyl-D-alanine carboxypeptidase [Candidatus Omnitrophus magneticus]|uniref:D-alanyl-D-alanine carboxypeptidase n=1 Tax=Candidatus Omnitrophus magneticus TaxID=1609969 RepID=A0A0F0CWT5_9BACT|nr:D-alanyl-D-alanine carboxypeptidase [Candidatus Omnitrophus magneticus]